MHIAHAQEYPVVPVSTLEVPSTTFTNASIGTEVNASTSSTEKVISSGAENIDSSSTVTEKVMLYTSSEMLYITYLLASPAWAEGTILSLSVCLSVCLPVCLFVYLFVYLFIHVSFAI